MEHAPSENLTPVAGPVPAAVPVAWSAVAGLMAFALALALQPGVVGDGDAGEFTLMLALGGVPHPPGYPLYTMSGHAWAVALHALGVSWASAANAWSALGGGVAVGLLHALAARAVPAGSPLGARGRASVALVPAVLLAANPAWISQAIVAEVHTWHVAVLCAMALATLGVLRALVLAEPPSGRGLGNRMLGWGLLCGAGLAHHPLALAFALPMGVALAIALARAGRLTAAPLARAALGLSLPLASYAFVWARAHHPAAEQWPLLEPTAASVLAHVRGSIFAARYLGRFEPLPEQWAALAGHVLPYLVAGLALVVFMAVVTRDRALRMLLVALCGAAALQLSFVLNYGVPDPVAYSLPVLLISLLGISAWLAWLAPHLPPRSAAIPVALGVAVIATLGVMWARDEGARLRAIERAIHDRWRAIPFERGIVLWSGDYYVRLRAYQVLDGERPGLYVESPAMLTWEPPRRAFERRFGVDPLAGLALTDDSQLPLIGENIARRTGLPVVDFERFRP